MNKSVYIITLITTCVFLTGFVVVRAINRTVLLPMSFGVSINEESIQVQDSLNVYVSDVILFAHLNNTGDNSLTEWQVNGESKVLSNEFEYTFKDAGTYFVKALNTNYSTYVFTVVVEAPEVAQITIEGGLDYKQGQVCTIIDETQDVKLRKWFINGELLDDEDRDRFKYQLIEKGSQLIKVVNRLNNGKLAVAEVQIEVAGRPVANSPVKGSGGGGGGGKALINRYTDIGYSLAIEDSKLGSIDSKDGKRLLEAILTASSKMNLTQFAVKGKNRKGKITITVMNNKGDVIETKELSCKPQNLYFPLNDGSGIDLKTNEILKIWIQLSDGAEIAFVSDKNNAVFTPYPGFELSFEKNLHWMFDLEVWTP